MDDQHTLGMPLSEKESNVLALMMLGLSYKTIGKKLNTSNRTIEQHAKRICAKIGASNRYILMAMVFERSLADLISENAELRAKVQRLERVAA